MPAGPPARTRNTLVTRPRPQHHIGRPDAAPGHAGRGRHRCDPPVSTPPDRYPDAVTSPDPTEPIQVDLARVAGVGTGLWAVALVVAVVLAAVGRTTWTPVAVCVVGALLGLAGIWWSRRHDTMGRRLTR